MPRNGSHHSHRRWCFGAENEAKPTTLLRFSGQGNACKSRLPWPLGSGDAAAINPGRRHRWLIPHRSTSRSNADCRPLLQQSSPNRGRVVRSDTD